MLENIRGKVFTRINDQRIKCDRWVTRICPNILKKLNVYIKESGLCHAIFNGESKFEVKNNEHRFTVDLKKQECSYRYWQLSGLPCPHAISCIFFRTNSLDDYVAQCYIRMPGRLKKERRREPTEQPKATRLSRTGTTIRCKNCKQIGHNKSTCHKRNKNVSTTSSALVAKKGRKRKQPTSTTSQA